MSIFTSHSTSEGNVQVEASIVYSDYQATLADGLEIDSGWIDMGSVDKYQVTLTTDTVGMDLVIESSSGAGGTGATLISTNTINTTFHLFNVIARQRYIRIRWQNNTGGNVNDASVQIKQTFGSSDKLSVFPLNVEPTDFSQAALVQSVIKGQQPDGTYTNTPATGSAFSTTANLGISGTYTSPWTDTNGWDHIEIFITSDVASVSEGIEVQFTDDITGTPTVRESRFFTFSADQVAKGFEIIKLSPVLKGFRVIYNNNSTAQTTFLLDATLRISGSTLTVNPSNALLVSDYTTEVSEGRIAGAEIWNKFGYNDDVDLAAPEVLAAFGGTFQYLTSGETVNIVSSDVADDAVGTGVQQLVIFGIDSNWDLAVDVVPLDGTTTVTSNIPFIGINRMTIFTSGSSNSNVGTITATAATSGYTMANMPAEQGTTQQCVFYVPRNYQFNATWLYFNALKSSGGGNPEVTFNGYVYSDVVQSEFEIYRDGISTALNEHIQLNPAEPFIIGEKSILWFEVSTTANNTSVRGRFSGKLLPTN